MSEGGADAAAGLRIVRGSPDDAELAALVAGVVAMTSSAADDDHEGAPTSAWMDRSRSMRGRRVTFPIGRGDAAWRHSLR